MLGHPMAVLMVADWRYARKRLITNFGLLCYENGSLVCKSTGKTLRSGKAAND